MISKNKIMVASLLAAWLGACSSSDEDKQTKDVGAVEDETDHEEKPPAFKGNYLQIDKFLLTEVPWREDDVTGKPLPGGGTTAQLFAKKQYNKVEANARKVLRSDPYEPRAIVALIQSLLMQRKFALAQIYANLNQKKLLANADFLNARGVTAYVVERGSNQGIKAAQEAFLAALKVAPHHTGARVNYGNILLLTSRDKDARETFVKLKSECKQCYVAAFGLATAATRLGKYPEAVENWQIAIQRNPKDYAARFYLVQTYLYGMKDKEKAKASLDKLLDEIPKDETEWLAKARDLQQALGGGKAKKRDDA